MRELLPQVRRVAVLAGADYPASMSELDEVQRIGAGLGLESKGFDARTVDEVAAVMKSLSGGGFDALYICGGPLINTARDIIISFAIAMRLPTMYNERRFVEAGGLIGYGPVVADMFRRAAELVDKILRGTKPGDIPIEQSTKLEMVVNLKTASAIGLTVSPALLARADEVIE